MPSRRSTGSDNNNCCEREKRASSNTNLDGYLGSFWPSRTAHLYIAVSILDFFLARDISFYEYVVHRSAVKRDSVRPHAGLPDTLSVWSVGI